MTREPTQYRGIPVEITGTRPTSPRCKVDYIGDTNLPDDLDFHIPGENKLTPLDITIESCYNQLIAWSMIQSYWFWVCSAPKVSDKEYDWIKVVIAQWEEECDTILPVGQTPSHEPLGYSPSNTWWGYCASRYPKHIQDMFIDVPVKMYMPIWNTIDFSNMKKEKRHVPKFLIQKRKNG